MTTYHRVRSTTQTKEDADRQEASRELCGKAVRWSDIPKVKAFEGPLPSALEDQHPGDEEEIHRGVMETLETATILKQEWGHDLGNPIAVVKAEPDELVRDVGLAFTEGHDDLDSVRIALLRAPSGTEYALLRHANAPKRGTLVLARTTASQPRRFAADLVELLRYLKLDGAAVAWLAPAVKPHWRGLAARKRPSTIALTRRRLSRPTTSGQAYAAKKAKTSRRAVKRRT